MPDTWGSPLKDSIQRFKGEFNITSGQPVFKSAAEQFKKDITKLLKETGATNIKCKIGRFYVAVDFEYRRRKHTLSIGDYLMYPDAKAYVLYTALKYNDRPKYSEQIPFAEEREFVQSLKTAINKEST